MEQFQTFFGLKSYLAFVAVEQLATTLQSKNISAELCSEAGQAAISFFERQRSLENFNLFYDIVLTECQELTDEPKLPRQRRVPQHIDEGSESFHPQTPKDYFRQQYFEVLDILVNELRRRFKQESLTVLHEIEDILISSCNSKLKNPSDKLIERYQNVVNFERLQPQLSILLELVNTANENNSFKVKEVTSVRTLCDMMNETSIGKVMFLEAS